MSKKSIIIILIGICVIIVAAVFCYAVFVKQETNIPVQPVAKDDVVDNKINEDDITKDWQVYSSKEFGFEMKYPSTLYLFDCSKSFHSYPLYICLTPYVEDNCNTPWKAKASVISISIIKDFNKDNIIDFLDKNIKEKNIIVGNKSAVQISCDREVVGDEGERSSSPSIREMVYTIIPIKNNISIEILYHRIVSVKNDASGFYVGKDLSEIYNKMLSTFKFVKPIDISNWETYNNEEFGFEIKHPKDWGASAGELEPRWHESVLGVVYISGSCSIENPDPFYAPIAITIRSNKERLSIKEWFQKNHPKDDTSRLQEVKFDKTSGIRVLSLWNDGLDGFFFSNEDKIYSVSIMDLQENAENQIMMNEKLLSTFKFINP